MDDALKAMVEQVRSAVAAARPLRIRSGGTKDFYGNAAAGELLDPRALRGILAHEPAELYVTVRAGTRLADLEATLAASGQMLACEPPHFGHDATVGGCVAAGLSGPRRAAAGFSYGSVRDAVLGAQLLDGRAQLLRFGGTVLKNVAGYDVARALAGSLGILGVITEVSLKVVPMPVAEVSLRLPMDERGALDCLCAWSAQPLPLSASAWCAGMLTLRLAGERAAVQAGARQLGGEALAPAAASGFWQGIREQHDAFFAAVTGDAAGDAPLWRISLPSAAAPLGLAGPQLIEWQGALRWLRTAQPAAQVRARAQALGGHATLFRGGDRAAGAFTTLTPALMAIHRRLKAEFDPAGVFNRGRMYAEF